MSDPCTPPDDLSYPSDCQILEGYRTRSREREEYWQTDAMQILFAKAKVVRLLLLDVDGVLTDGTLIYTESGGEAKSFNTQDGLGIRLIQKGGTAVGLITARQSEIVARRAAELGMDYIRQGVGKKRDAYNEILDQADLKPFEVCYMGDDWIDLGLLARVGLAACPANAVAEVKDVCHYIASRSGGHGAVRELCDLILRAKGQHQSLLQHYMS
jgi:3-deoxy-D-manno-octulosonate 8-phosphate phosphatase (KDO 8-P phosphatase)